MDKLIIVAVLCLILTACVAVNPAPSEAGGGESLNTSADENESMPINRQSEQERSEEPKMRNIVNYDYLKAIWVSQFDMNSVYVSGGGQRPKEDYVQKVTEIIENISSLGFNTIIYQIRPNGDSMYQSGYYPVSKYVAGGYGRELSYDPVEVFVETAKSHGLSVHAWINPMRLMSPSELGAVKEGFILKDWYRQGKLPEVGGLLYLDVSRKEARDLIVGGAVEALEKYDFDGLHMDDYFYPTSDPSFDKATFDASGETDLVSFREDAINKLVSSLYRAVKDIDERLWYGISPAGNLRTVVSTYFADVYAWCGSDGYIDYILPQVYFGLLHGSCPFEQTVKDWAGIIKNNSTKLYIGMSLGKAVSGSQGNEDRYAVTNQGKREWIENKDVIKRCLEFVNGYEKADGYCFFCYQYFYDPVSGRENSYSKQEVEAMAPLVKQDKQT